MRGHWLYGQGNRSRSRQRRDRAPVKKIVIESPPGSVALHRFCQDYNSSITFTDRMLVEDALRNTWNPTHLAGLIPTIETLLDKYPEHTDNLRAGLEYLRSELHREEIQT